MANLDSKIRGAVLTRSALYAEHLEGNCTVERHYPLHDPWRVGREPRGMGAGGGMPGMAQDKCVAVVGAFSRMVACSEGGGP